MIFMNDIKSVQGGYRNFAVLFLSVLLVACGRGGVESAANALPLPLTGNSNQIGINIAAPLDYEGDRLYADVIKTSRNFISGSNPDVTTPAPVDGNGWPTSDFSFYVWAGIGNMDGTYTLSFTGQANVSSNPRALSAISYDSGTNTSTATIQVTSAASSFLTLSFTGTKRTAASASGTGVTSIKLMRPLTPGSTQSYPSTTLFNAPIKSLIAKFSVIRFMDFLATNVNIQTNWADRPLPTWPSFNRAPAGSGWQGNGGPWEHVILLMNETGKDAWINIPQHATDQYVLNVARMFKYGSNGVDPYTSAQANPVYPPLNANLNLYVEYSNELWNSSFKQFNDNCKAASDELVNTAGNSPLNWDGLWDGTSTFNGTAAVGSWNWKFCDRQTTKRSVEISNIFRTVFGDAAMGTRIRPVLMSQLGNAGGTLFNETQMMLDYYDNMAVNSSVTLPTAHAPNYYFYGAGGSSYYSPPTTVSTLDAFFADPGMTPAGMRTPYQEDTKLTTTMGLKRIAYEGGPDLGRSSPASPRDAIAQSAIDDPRMTTAMVNMHNEWSRDGGDLLVYYVAVNDFQWGFTQDVYNLATRKLLAVDALNAVDRASPTYGTPVPGSVSGSVADACSRGWGCNPIASYDSFTANGSSIVWASYSFRSTAPAAWTINLSFTSASANAAVAVYVDDILIDTQTTSGSALSFNAGTIASGLHGVEVRAASGTFALGSVAIATN
jgi:hypothetical protein